jgi:hypothetical protein
MLRVTCTGDRSSPPQKRHNSQQLARTKAPKLIKWREQLQESAKTQEAVAEIVATTRAISRSTTSSFTRMDKGMSPRLRVVMDAKCRTLPLMEEATILTTRGLGIFPDNITREIHINPRVIIRRMFRRGITRRGTTHVKRMRV